jgi:hypothetical protein
MVIWLSAPGRLPENLMREGSKTYVINATISDIAANG